MKKNNVLKVFITLLALGSLIGCGSGKNPFSNNNNNPFVKSSTPKNDKSSVNGNNGDSTPSGGGQSNNNSNSGGNNNGDEVTFDENSTKFGHTFSGTGAGEVAIQVNADNCKDDDLTIPSTYVDSKGNKYKVTMDYGNGFGYLSAQKITLLEGFKEIHEGFDNCMYVKTIYLPSTITKFYGEILTSCISLTKIDFAGTKEQWNAIEKAERWNYRAPAFDVSCKDGTINVEKGPTD